MAFPLLLPALLLSGVTVVLPMEAEVRGTEITVGQVAEIASADPALAARVASVGLGGAPAPGFSRLLTAPRIARSIESALPGVEVRLEGHGACRVWPQVVTVAGSAIRAAAEAELARALGGGPDVTFAPTSAIDDVLVPSGARAPELRVRLADRAPTSGVVGVPVRVLVDGAPWRTVWTSWEVRAWETVPVLAAPVAPGEELRAALLEERRLPLDPARGSALAARQLDGAVAARALPAGAPVTARDVHRPTVVEAGQTLLLEVRSGRVAARTPARALEPGAVGDRIRVRGAAAAEHLAVVVDRDLVRIVLGEGRRVAR